MAAPNVAIPPALLDALGARPPLTARPGMQKADKDLETIRKDAAKFLQRLATRFADDPAVAEIGELIDKLLQRPEHIMPDAAAIEGVPPSPNGSVAPKTNIPAALLAAMQGGMTGAPTPQAVPGA